MTSQAFAKAQEAAKEIMAELKERTMVAWLKFYGGWPIKLDQHNETMVREGFIGGFVAGATSQFLKERGRE